MALSKQSAPTQNLKIFMTWADAAGYRVNEHPDYGGVTAVHTKGSWHYDGLAADINWGAPGSPRGEAGRLLAALAVAESMGLAVIYARDGVEGAAANHQSHLHVDVGSWSNHGAGNVHSASGDLVPWRIQGAVYPDGPVVARDNIWGPDTDKRVWAVRQASAFAGELFPYGVEYTQQVVGTADDGDWGDLSRLAHDHAVAAIQRALSVGDDGRWGNGTEGAYQRARKVYRR